MAKRNRKHAEPKSDACAACGLSLAFVHYVGKHGPRLGDLRYQHRGPFCRFFCARSAARPGEAVVDENGKIVWSTVVEVA